MIRPSQLQIAELCALAPKLAEQYPTTSGAATYGTDIHRQVDLWIKQGYLGINFATEVVALARHWAPPKGIKSEHPVSLIDPDEDEIITEGTCDAYFEQGGCLFVIDWKTGQTDYVENPNENLQLLAYGVALSMQSDVDRFIPSLCFLREDKPLWLHGTPVYESEWLGIIDRIKAIQSKPPVASPGMHCESKCFQRRHCYTRMLPAHDGVSALDFVQKGGLTRENAAKAIQIVNVLKDAVGIAEDALKDYARDNGGISDGNGKVWGPVQVNGRKTADIKALEADGMHKYLRQGTAYESFRWKKA